MILGRVISLQSGFYTVYTGQETVICRPRGRLKMHTERGDIIAIGDDVQITIHSGGGGTIDKVEPRRKALVRLDPRPRGVFKQILLANPDQIVCVFACADPEPHLRMLDRFLVIAEKQEVPAVIVANKVDLIGLEQAHTLFQMYAPLGYPVVFTSARTGLGLDELRSLMKDKLNGLAGPSGVGKSSLLNAIQPNLGLAVREVSDSTFKGRHTTIVRKIFPLADGGFVADLPGLRSLALWDTQPEELDGYFPELRDLVSACQFNDCTHMGEPGCAVQAAVKAGTVHPERYKSYVRLRTGEE